MAPPSSSSATGASRMPSFNFLRTRSYVFRLPLFTRLIVFLIVLLWFLSLQSTWDVQEWGALVPDKIGFTTAYRTNTFPLVHLNFFHALINVLALTPLLERFESEYGTLTSLALFFGPLSTFPALLYVFIERGILRSNTAVMGARFVNIVASEDTKTSIANELGNNSIWVFLLLGMEAIRTYRTNPHLVIATYHIPTWTTPLMLLLVLSALVPQTSLLGHLCGLAFGYLAGMGYMKFVAPPEWALRWIEGKLNLLGRLPHYVSVDQKTYGRFGVLPSSGGSAGGSGVPLGYVGSTQRLGP